MNWRVQLFMDETKDKLCWLIVRLLPARAVLFAFVKVHALSGDCPGKEYCEAYDLWTHKHNLY